MVQLRQPKVARGKRGALIAGLPPGIIGMEACSGACHWARKFQAHGHTVRLMAPKLVTPYRTSGERGKYDAADAAVICEAMQRPNMRFVPIKTERLLHVQSLSIPTRPRQAPPAVAAGHSGNVIRNCVAWPSKKETITANLVC